jgi:hypothetical protein
LIDAIIPGESNTLFGWSLGSAGDINADGSADLIVGQPLWSVNGSYSGRIRVFSGADETELLVIDGPYIDTGRPATNITGYFSTLDSSSLYHNAGPAIFPDEDNVVRGGNVDLVGLGPIPPGTGAFEWKIPLEVRVRGIPGNPWIRLSQIVTQRFELNQTCLTVSKDGDSHTVCSHHDTIVPDLDDPQCPP